MFLLHPLIVCTPSRVLLLSNLLCWFLAYNIPEVYLKILSCLFLFPILFLIFLPQLTLSLFQIDQMLFDFFVTISLCVFPICFYFLSSLLYFASDIFLILLVFFL